MGRRRGGRASSRRCSRRWTRRAGRSSRRSCTRQAIDRQVGHVVPRSEDTAMRRHGSGRLIGTSAAIIELTAEIERVAASDAKVLITGESGVGKELVAHSVHQNSARAQRPMVAMNCAGLPETLLESELFGHVKGSFTGAYRDKLGKLELANGGTVFLDEIGEMTLRMQGLLLRFLETGELQKVGAFGESKP